MGLSKSRNLSNIIFRSYDSLVTSFSLLVYRPVTSPICDQRNVDFKRRLSRMLSSGSSSKTRSFSSSPSDPLLTTGSALPASELGHFVAIATHRIAAPLTAMVLRGVVENDAAGIGIRATAQILKFCCD
jgi:hypothetical protein